MWPSHNPPSSAQKPLGRAHQHEQQEHGRHIPQFLGLTKADARLGIRNLARPDGQALAAANSGRPSRPKVSPKDRGSVRCESSPPRRRFFGTSRRRCPGLRCHAGLLPPPDTSPACRHRTPRERARECWGPASCPARRSRLPAPRSAPGRWRRRPASKSDRVFRPKCSRGLRPEEPGWEPRRPPVRVCRPRASARAVARRNHAHGPARAKSSANARFHRWPERRFGRAR